MKLACRMADLGRLTNARPPRFTFPAPAPMLGSRKHARRAGKGMPMLGNYPASHDYTTRQLEALAALAGVGPESTERQIIQVGVDIAQRATGSQIAYIHFLNEGEETIELGTWSHDTLAHCSTTYDRHYPVRAAGNWADTVRTRCPVLHNDFARSPNQRGLPEGHAPLHRHLGVPIEVEGHIRLLIGVGNKPEPYDDDDIRTVDLVGRRLWSLLQGRRELERLRDLERRFDHVKRIATVAGWEYDPAEDAFRGDDMLGPLFQLRSRAEAPMTLDAFLALISPRDRARVRGALTGHGPAARFALRLRGIRKSSETFQAELKGEVRAREVGEGSLMVGILQDLTERNRLEDLQHAAETDALTALPNRRRLKALFDAGQVGRRGVRDGWAFLYIDLDAFKPVNDTYGHAAGDEVLRQVARRLTALVRKDDLVVRLGGDEFAIVQTGLADPRGAEVLAAKVVEVCARPIDLGGDHVVQVGASVGVAVCPAGTTNLADLAERADRALYEAKKAGRNRVAVSAP